MQQTVMVMDKPTPSKSSQRLPTYERATNPPPMRLTERDKAILEAVHTFEVLADYQIRQLFFTGRRQCRDRLSKLYQHGYLERPDRRRRATLTCMVYWLSEQGAGLVAGLYGQDLAEFGWRKGKHPRWLQIEHDLAVNDFRIAVMQACEQQPAFTLEEWVGQGEFWARPDTVTYPGPDGKTDRRKVRPDGYFVIVLGGKRFRLLLELDRANEDNPRIGREKVLPGIAYIRSEAYARRFGHSSGRWLIVTTSERRMQNMKRQTEQIAEREAKQFYFTTLDQVTSATVLTGPIWWRGGEERPSALFRELP